MLWLSDCRDEQMRLLIHEVSAICLSAEFHALREELEKMYARCGVENAMVVAFQDALYTLLAESGAEPAARSRPH